MQHIVTGLNSFLLDSKECWNQKCKVLFLTERDRAVVITRGTVI